MISPFCNRHPQILRITACALLFAGVPLLAPLCAARAQQADKGLDLSGAVTPATGQFAGQRFYTGSHVLIVGVSHYEYLPKDLWLRFADRDARDLRDLLIRNYGVPAASITLLLNEQATKANIETALNSFADSVVGPDDRVLIYFSGHGQTVPLATGGEKGFLIPYDAKVDLTKPQDKGAYFSSCIAMDSLWGLLSASAARHALVIADACYGGLLVQSKALGGERPSATVIASLLTRPARQVLTAGGAGETALEDPSLGHGAFTYKLLEELRAQAATPDTVFTASELASALKTSVGNLTNAHQTPQFGDYGGTEGEFLFVTTPPRDVAPIVEVQPAPPPVPDNPTPTPAVINPAPPAVNPEHPVIPPPSGNTGTSRPSRINPKDGAEMVYVPAGTFPMGDDDDAIADHSVTPLHRNNPRHSVTLSGYYIYKNLVTVAMYRKFCDATRRQIPRPLPWGWKEDHPIVNVSWDDAKVYCDWAGARLPTEAEWEKAARGTDGRKYPWGNDWDTNMLWCSQSNIGDAGATHSVGGFASGASPYGCFDMAGNVLQWCADWFDEDFWVSRRAAEANPVNDVTSKDGRVQRGGPWNFTGPEVFRTAFRLSGAPSDQIDCVGFRAVIAAEPP